MIRLMALLILSCSISLFVCGCSEEDKSVVAQSNNESVHEEVKAKITYEGGVDYSKGVQEVMNMNSDYAYTDETFVNTDDLPDSIRTPLSNELPAVQTALLSLVKQYCTNLGINYELLSWETPLTEQYDNHTVYLLKGVASTIRIHVASTDRVVACIE